MEIVESKDVTPVCPHCDREMPQIVRVPDDKGWFQGHKGYCYVCPHCHKVLGFADYAT